MSGEDARAEIKEGDDSGSASQSLSTPAAARSATAADADATPEETTASSEPASASGTEQRPDERSTLLVLESVTKRFGGLVAVDDLSFAVREGEILGFIGPNGAGKTTTFNCVMGTYEPTAGSIHYRGEDITGVPTHAIVNRGIARTFQNAQPIEEFTVAQNVAFSLLDNRLFGLSIRSETLQRRVAELCDLVGFDRADLEKEPDELPHAGLLKLELARALAVDPDLLLVDEVFAGLAAGEVDEFVQTIRGLRDRGYTFVVIDHNMRGLLELIDRAIVLNFGEKIAEGTPAEIKRNERVRQAYFGGDAP